MVFLIRELIKLVYIIFPSFVRNLRTQPKLIKYIWLSNAPLPMMNDVGRMSIRNKQSSRYQMKDESFKREQHKDAKMG